MVLVVVVVVIVVVSVAGDSYVGVVVFVCKSNRCFVSTQRRSQHSQCRYQCTLSYVYRDYETKKSGVAIETRLNR